MDELCITSPKGAQALSSQLGLSPQLRGKGARSQAGFTNDGLIMLKGLKKDLSNSQFTSPHALPATGTYHIKDMWFVNPLFPIELLLWAPWTRGLAHAAFVNLWATGVCSVDLSCCSSNKSFPHQILICYDAEFNPSRRWLGGCVLYHCESSWKSKLQIHLVSS